MFESIQSTCCPEDIGNALIILIYKLPHLNVSNQLVLTIQWRSCYKTRNHKRSRGYIYQTPQTSYKWCIRIIV